MEHRKENDYFADRAKKTTVTDRPTRFNTIITDRHDQHDYYRPTDRITTTITDRQGHPIITDRQGQRNYYRPTGSTRLLPTSKATTSNTDGQAQHNYYQQTDRPNTNITDIRTDTGVNTTEIPIDQKTSQTRILPTNLKTGATRLLQTQVDRQA